MLANYNCQRPLINVKIYEMVVCLRATEIVLAYLRNGALRNTVWESLFFLVSVKYLLAGG